MRVEIIGTHALREDGGSPEALLEHAGRACYRSEPKGEPGKFLRARVREGHESLIEHASVTFEISGISRACSHQLVRHRIASYSQESQRYVDMSRARVRGAALGGREPRGAGRLGRVHGPGGRYLPPPARRWECARRMLALCCPTPPRRASS